jgi:hypothetical protein
MQIMARQYGNGTRIKAKTNFLEEMILEEMSSRKIRSQTLYISRTGEPNNKLGWIKNLGPRLPSGIRIIKIGMPMRGFN